MNFSEDTKNILDLVEQRTGYPIQTISDSSMQVLAKVKMASEEFPVHIVSYKPNARGVDYHIAYECGFILRLYENPPEERYHFAATDVGRSLVRKALSSNKQLKRMGLPDESVKQLTNQFFDGLMTQLRSVPIGLRIDQWIWDDHPSLRESQKTSMAKQQQDNVQALSPQVRSVAPVTVFNANAAMNAAYALFCDRLLRNELYVVPYRSAGFENTGERLIELLDELPKDGIHDRELVDAWGEELEIANWYKWIPVKLPNSTER
jgi:hypothetical protein